MSAKIVIRRTNVKILCVMAAVILCSSFSSIHADTIVRFDTIFGNFHVQLTDSVTPLTVQNFLNYVNDDDYANSFFHRLMPGFVLQGGGFTYSGGKFRTVPADPPVQNEFNISNTYGTIAMAKISGDPNSATNQFFFNLADNSANLDNQNGGFTVFGSVMGSGMNIVNALAAQQPQNEVLSVIDSDTGDTSNIPFSNLPIIVYEGNQYLEMVSDITVVIHGDANGDGVVSAADYAAVQANFGNTGDVGITGDANFDGIVSAADYATVQANFGNTAPSGTTPTPEPATIGMLCIGAAVLLGRKRTAGK